jgi:hypothetical protein
MVFQCWYTNISSVIFSLEESNLTRMVFGYTARPDQRWFRHPRLHGLPVQVRHHPRPLRWQRKLFMLFLDACISAVDPEFVMSSCV